MFGKGRAKKSSADRFVTAMGKKAGNFGNTSGGKGGAKGKETPDPFTPRTLKVGKNSRFSAE